MDKDYIIPHGYSSTECRKSLDGIGDALYAIGGKWKLQIIMALKQDNNRFNQLQRAVTGISSKVLATELKELELNGFVQRNVDNNTQAGVRYELTEYSDSLYDVLKALSQWGIMHRETIKNSMRLPVTKR